MGKTFLCWPLFFYYSCAFWSGGGDDVPLVIDDSKNCGPLDSPWLGFIYQDFDYSKTILDWQEDVTGKPLKILEAAQAGLPEAPGVVVSGAFWGNYLTESTNKPGKFPILSRFPDERGNIATSSDRWVASNAAFGITARPIDWITFYSQYEYTEVEFPVRKTGSGGTIQASSDLYP